MNIVEFFSLVVGNFAMVADKLEAADHLADGEETKALSGDDAASGQLDRADTSGALEKGLGGADATGLDSLVEVLVEVLERGSRALYTLAGC